MARLLTKIIPSIKRKNEAVTYSFSMPKSIENTKENHRESIKSTPDFFYCNNCNVLPASQTQNLFSRTQTANRTASPIQFSLFHQHSRTLHIASFTQIIWRHRRLRHCSLFFFSIPETIHMHQHRSQPHANQTSNAASITIRYCLKYIFCVKCLRQA